ncbi:MAG: hypothetical protein ABI658_10230 [Acidimicrobiales bacterium]
MSVVAAADEPCQTAGGGERLYAESIGVEQVFVGGREIVTNCVLTGALPGTVLRAGKDTDTITVADRSFQPGSTK